MSSGIKIYSANLAIAARLICMIDGWFDRFKNLVREREAGGESLRSISLRAGLNTHYLTNMFRKDSPPTVENFFALCTALEKDPFEILTGVKQDAETRGVLRRVAALPPDQRKAFLAGLAALQPEDDDQPG